ncbi:MAG: FAD-dependent oxidoreductase [Syntrophorhabdaceae bacterium]|nr:FAD-dependent oxidoreductase [Syntrophorhabdales bacterium]MBP9561410.1 FAD-dependent oxidoreductase [Syntrophorhabdaceae bacterium]
MYAKRLELIPENIYPIEWIDEETAIIKGTTGRNRVSSKVLEEYIQQAAQDGARVINIYADGQHGIGGRIWQKRGPVKIIVNGPVGQRCGSMGTFGTEIIVHGSASDDVGWLNCGAKITILGDVTNGAFNAAAQGILYVQGSGGARCDTLTKHNPRFDPPQSWYLRDVGDSFAEFKAGGISVVCGVNPRDPDNVLGYRPCVGMVGGIIYFKGRIQGFSEKDVRLLHINQDDWEWLKGNMMPFLSAIDRLSLYHELTSNPDEWKKLIPYTPEERRSQKKASIPISDFRKKGWEKEVGEGGIFADYIEHDRWSVIPYIATGDLRRSRPVWSNEKYEPPCAYVCPTHIPTHKRTRLIREGKISEALEMMLQYSPIPETVCGGICPNLCIDACTRARHDRAIRVDRLVKIDSEISPQKPIGKSGKKVAVIGSGPAGIAVSWQLVLKGHEIHLYEASERLGGKIERCIPEERLPRDILNKEIERFKEIGIHLHLNTKVDKEIFEDIYKKNDVVVVACGAHKPRRLDFPGSDHAITAYDFLRMINEGKKPNLTGKKVLIIGAGNVGMDVASEAYIYGAESVTAIDIQRPAAFGKELEIARKKGVKIIWPKSIERYDKDSCKVFFKDNTSIAAHLVIIAIGDMPLIDFVPISIHSEKGWIKVDEFYQTSDPKVYAIGDVTGLGLVTHAIGHGNMVAEHIHARLMAKPYSYTKKDVIPYRRIKTEYYDFCVDGDKDPGKEAERCLSCGTCRDCHICEITCHFGAIKRTAYDDGTYEYVVDDERCIGCGFCAGVCPCGVWEMEEF